MLFEDSKGNILSSKELDALYPWEVEERGIHVYGDIAWVFQEIFFSYFFAFLLNFLYAELIAGWFIYFSNASI